MDESITVNVLEHSSLNKLLEYLQKYGSLIRDFRTLRSSNIKEKLFVGTISKIGSVKYREHEDGQKNKYRPVLVMSAENLVGDKKQSKQLIRICFIGNVVSELLNKNIQITDIIAILNPRVFPVHYSKSTLLTLSVGPFNVTVWFCRNLEGSQKTTTLAEEETTFGISGGHSESLPIDLEKDDGGISNIKLIHHQTQNASKVNSLEFQQIPNPTTNNNLFSKNTERTDVTLSENRSILLQNTDLVSSLEGPGCRIHSNVDNQRANFPDHSHIQSGCCPSRQFRCGHENSCFHNFYHCAHCICQCGIQRCQFQCLYHSLKNICSCVNSCKCACSNMKSCRFNRVCTTKLYCCNYQKSLCLPETFCPKIIHYCSRISKINCCRNKEEDNLQQSLNPDLTIQMERITRTKNWIDQCIPHSPYKQIVPIQVDSSSSSNASNSPYKQIIPIPVNSSSSSNASKSPNKQIVPTENDSSSSSNTSSSSFQLQHPIRVSSRKVVSNQTNNKNVRHSVKPFLPKKKIKFDNPLEYSRIIVTEGDSIFSEHRDTPSSVMYCQALPRKASEVVTDGPPENATEDIFETPQEHLLSNEPIELKEQHKMQTGNVEGTSLMEQNKSWGSVCDLSQHDQMSTKSDVTIDLEQEKSVKDNVNLSTDSLHSTLSTRTLSQKSEPSPSDQWIIKDVNEISAYATTAEKLSQQNITVPQSHPLTFSVGQVIPVKALIINMIPDPANIALLIKGMCNDKCRSLIYYSEFDEMERMDISTCRFCKYRIHYACPVCHKDGRKFPLCIFFSLELHLLINNQVLRVEATHADAVNFFGCPPSVYLKAYQRVSKILKNNIIYHPITQDSLTFLNAKIKPKKRNGMPILTLFSTNLTKHLERNGSLFKFPLIK